MFLPLDLMEKINKRLAGLAKKFYNKKSKDVTYIGIHIRRTDFLKFSKQHLRLKPLNSDYYNYAMEYFEEEYENCIFVVASDDIKWAKRKLEVENHKIYFSDQNPTFHPLPGSKFEVVDDDLSKAVHDFALLASCNHTIISRGIESIYSRGQNSTNGYFISSM